MSSPNVIVTSVKRAEDESGLIVRMYESSGIRTNVEWNLEAFARNYIYECDMMEQKKEKLCLTDREQNLRSDRLRSRHFLLV